ncbi:MAG: hypothetical protein JO262_12065 [Solirubrobacterales bacterium]|nr:hypothetical protein [Solirubrobacterales bacterium]
MHSTTIPDPTSTRTREHSGPGVGIYIAFVPWVLFTLVAQHSTLKWAAVVALAVSAAIALPSLVRGRPKLLEIGALLTFAGFTAVALQDPGASEWVTRYARAMAAALLALIAFGSLLVVPFTEQYARESVPRQLWSSPRFRKINRQLTTMWALVFAAMVPAHVIAGAVGTHRANLIFNWAIPTALIVWAAKRTASVSDAAGAQA